MRSAANALWQLEAGSDVYFNCPQMHGSAVWLLCCQHDAPIDARVCLAVQSTPSVASGMIGNQRLEHFGEPRRKPLGSDALGSDAGALPYQEDFVGETLGIGQPGIAAQAN